MSDMQTETNTALDGVPEKFRDAAGKYLTFHLGDETYCIHLLKIREIMGVIPTTKVPSARNYIKGVMNLRGKVIPVVDLRKRLSMPPMQDETQSCIIVLALMYMGQFITVGMIVDSVSDMMEISAEQIKEPPKYSNHLKSEFMLGMVTNEGKVSTIVDIEKVMFSKEMLKREENKNLLN